jgi:hypothetical protein
MQEKAFVVKPPLALEEWSGSSIDLRGDPRTSYTNSDTMDYMINKIEFTQDTIREGVLNFVNNINHVYFDDHSFFSTMLT